MNALIDRAVTDVEVEAVFFGEVGVRSCPSVGCVDCSCEVEGFFSLVAVDAVAVEYGLDEPDVVEWV